MDEGIVGAYNKKDGTASGYFEFVEAGGKFDTDKFMVEKSVMTKTTGVDKDAVTVTGSCDACTAEQTCQA